MSELDLRVDGFPLSPQQRDLWLLQKGSCVQAFRCCCIIRIEGPLDLRLLQSSLRDVVERHEILRTTFERLPEMDMPLQVVQEMLEPRWSEPLSGADLEDLASCAEQSPVFEVDRGPLLAATLSSLAPARHLLMLQLPSLCMDAAGLVLLARELAGAYAARVAGRQTAEEPLQYVDLAEWQNGIFAAEDSQAGIQYWQAQDLSGLEGLALPCEQRSEEEAFQPRRLTVPLAAAEALARWPGASREDLLLAVWIALLHRLTQRTEIVTGVACDGRDYAELEAVPGLFARVLPLAVEVAEDLPFTELLRRVRQAKAGMVQWQQCFRWERSANGLAVRPFPPFCFEHWGPAVAVEAGAGVTFALERRSAWTERFRLQLLCIEREDRTEAELAYDAGRLAAGDVEILGGQLAALLQDALRNPDGAIGAFDLLSAAERESLLVRFNETADVSLEPVEEAGVHELFARWADRCPDRVAVVCGDGQLSYGELDARANRLAHRLSRLGVGPDAPVALYLDRSIEMLIALLAVLKAGGAYVPLDPALPRERLAYMLADSRPAALLTERSLLAALPGNVPRTIDLTAEAARPAHEPVTDPPRRTAGENLAYVIYTSGSTGRPKGVAVGHRQLSNYVCGILQRAPLPPEARLALVSTLAADLGNTTLFGALCGGGCLHVISQDTSRDPEMLGESFLRSMIDAVKLVPSHLRALLQGASPERVLPRRQLILGGEACGRDLIARVRALAPGCRVLNHYGPTETTVGVLTHTVAGDGPGAGSVLPLDRPLPNSRIYLLDRRLRPVARWAGGEIHIGGAGLARGYLQRPDLTAERFLPDPFSAEPGARMYRTGDLARFLSAGGLEILGRIDHQVKIRGHRVELGEIEGVLHEHPDLASAVVVAWSEGDGEKRLVAYVVPKPGAQPAPAELRQHLALRVPEPMMPSAFVVLMSLPLTANGKLDRQALPAPGSVRAREGGSSAPRTTVEEMVADIWAEVLRQDSVGIHDSFFDLGGHSLLVAQVVSRVRECFAIELPLRALFEEPTVSGLAARIEAARSSAGLHAAPPIERAPRNQKLALSFAQQRLWFFDRLQPGSSFYNIVAPTLLTGALDLVALERSLTEIVRRHEVLRTTFASFDGEPAQVVGAPGPWKLPLVDVSALGGEPRARETARLAAEDAARPFDLERGPLLRTSLVRIEPDRHLLLLSLHHIVSDAWSMQILLRELAALYEAFSAGRPSPLPELPVQYADFAAWQRRWLSGDRLESEIAYWRSRLAGAPPALEIPADRPRPRLQTFNGASASAVLPAPLAAELRRLARREGVTMFMLLLAAFKAQLRHYAGCSDILVGSNVACRDRLEIEGLIGFFINQLVLRTDLSGNPGFREVLARVRSVTLDAYAHQHLPFEKLVEELRPPRDRSRSLLFQIKLEYTDEARSREAPVRSLRTEAFPGERPLARYDLHLSLANVGQEISSLMLYNADLFEPETVRGFLADYQKLLEAIAGDPDIRLEELGRCLVQNARERRTRDEEVYEDAVLQKLRSRRRSAAFGSAEQAGTGG